MGAWVDTGLASCPGVWYVIFPPRCTLLGRTGGGSQGQAACSFCTSHPPPYYSPCRCRHMHLGPWRVVELERAERGPSLCTWNPGSPPAGGTKTRSPTWRRAGAMSSAAAQASERRAEAGRTVQRRRGARRRRCAKRLVQVRAPTCESRSVGKGKRISDISEDEPSVYTCRQLHEMLRCRAGAGGGMARRAAAANGGEEVVKLWKEAAGGRTMGYVP